MTKTDAGFYFDFKNLLYNVFHGSFEDDITFIENAIKKGFLLLPKKLLSIKQNLTIEKYFSDKQQLAQSQNMLVNIFNGNRYFLSILQELFKSGLNINYDSFKKEGVVYIHTILKNIVLLTI